MTASRRDLFRRDFIKLSATSVASTALLAGGADPVRAKGPIGAVVFDGFAVIDARPVAARIAEMFPDAAKPLMAAWRTRQFDYAWLRSMAGQYADFWRVTEDALTAAAESLGLKLTAQQRDELMQTHLALKAWPDAGPALRRLKATGMKLAFLSNFTAPMLDAAAKNSGLEDLLEPHLTTDLVKAYKPDPRAYAMALDAFSLTRGEVAFVAFAGWDVAGAKWFGYPVYWANRAGAPADRLGVAADHHGSDLSELAGFIGA
jgi:2-haloacid dehalogenase